MIGRNAQSGFNARDAAPRVFQLHDHDCTCSACAPYVPSSPDMLTWQDMGKLAVAGAVVGSIVAFCIDPAGAAAALFATIAR